MSDMLYYWSSTTGYSGLPFHGDDRCLTKNSAFLDAALQGAREVDCNPITGTLREGTLHRLPIGDVSSVMLIHVTGFGYSLVFNATGESIVLPVLAYEDECVLDLDRVPLPADLDPETMTARVRDKATFIHSPHPGPEVGLRGREAFLTVLDSLDPATRAQSALADLLRFMPDGERSVDLDQICHFLKAWRPGSPLPPIAPWEIEDAHDLLLGLYVNQLDLAERDTGVMLEISGKDAFLREASFRQIRERSFRADDRIAERQSQREREREREHDALVEQVEPQNIVIIEDIPREVPADDGKPHPYDVSVRWGGLTEPRPLLGNQAMMPDASGDMALIATLRRKAPWMEAAISEIEEQMTLSQHAGREWLHFSPILLVGPPGSGKSHFARMLAMSSGVPYAWQSLAGVTDNRNLEGTARGWSNALPCWPLTVMDRKRVANPILFVDEIDKVGECRNGDPRETLLSMIEEQESRVYFDRCLQANADLGHISWMFAANEAQLVSPILLSRMEIVKVREPGPEHFPVILENVMEDIAGRWGMARELLPDLPEIIVEGLSRDFAKSKSLRSASKDIRKAVGRQLRASREQAPTRSVADHLSADFLARLDRG